ncbi:MAG: ATP-binding cassette domain-containing protein, partial [Bacteroidales bacterium]|nr:ATP-binding cassette domain-containing protein [Bacteroidales bacterium]
KRWNQHDIDDSPLVSELLQETINLISKQEIQLPEEYVKNLYEMFNLDALLGKRIVTLSSGELRKFQLTKALLYAPRVLIIDNPFIGLDAQTRTFLKQLFSTLSKSLKIQFILVLSRQDEIPEFITHVVEVKDMVVHDKECAEDYRSRTNIVDSDNTYNKIIDKIINIPYSSYSQTNYKELLDFRNVTIKYGDRIILNQLNWKVEKGEFWSLSGANGSGKSTLLSLVCADNPQAYACDIRLFGNKRGTGESIWDIKKHIGYVSPEMHRAYLKDLPAIDIVASGLHDSVGLYVRPKPEQKSICEFWMDIFGILKHKDKTFLKLSSGEQRLVLLARAFVKDPELLILDEPLHGLDTSNREKVKVIINTFAKRKGKTIVMVTHYKEELPSCFTKHLVLKSK